MSPPRPSLSRLWILAAAVAALACQAAPAPAKVGSSVAGQILTVRGGRGADRVSVTCNAQGLVKVNARDPGTGPLQCSRVSEVDAVTGDGNDRVNLSGVGGAFGQGDFPGFGHGTGAAAQLGPGNDRYVGSGTSFNLVIGGAGADRVRGGAIRDSITGGAGNDSLAGGGGRDVMLGNSGIDHVAGGADDDLISGNAGDDLLAGGAGADLIGGGQGKDHLLGGPGPDQLLGGAGKDRLNGGPGNNTLVQDSPKKK